MSKSLGWLCLFLPALLLGCRTGDKAAEADTGALTDGLVDADGDGFRSDEDCDDADASANPGATEVCDGVDNDCDGVVDGPDAADATDWYLDQDSDGYGDPETVERACDAPDGAISDGRDCDDAEPTAWPDAPERCDGIDNDCDGVIDNDVQTTWYGDGDGDGFGDASSPIEACDPPSGAVLDATDCDDLDANVFPGNPEVCDELDNDCDGAVDEGVTTTFFADTDGDGHGDVAATVESCALPEGYAASGEDCDDGDPAISPDAIEVCDAADNDCDGLVDIDDPGVADAGTYYRDGDGDGYGDVASAIDACAQPSGTVTDATDCDDAAAAVHPAAIEVCDRIDNDCDGLVDIDDPGVADAGTFYADSDGDGYGDAATATEACAQPSGTVTDSTDCDDADPSASPASPELRDGVDNDCDGAIDDDLHRGTGADGALGVTGTTDLSVDASGGRAAADAVSFGVTGIAGDTLTLDAAATGLAAGDEVLIVNLQGTASAYSAVGAWEFGSVGSASGSSLTLLQSVSGTYGEVTNSDLTGQVVVVQRVPQYTDVAVAAGAALTTAPWDGAGGGVLAFRATGTVSVAATGAVTVAELGYAGGDTGPNSNDDAYQGESYPGAGAGGYAGGPYNQANGAYAANGGGGGANVTGGGGNHAGGATAGDSWDGGGYTAPSAGGTYGDANLDSIFFGSGGGGVWNGGSDNVGEDPGPGGDGGGVLYIGAGLVDVDGALAADGGDTSHWAQGTWTYGAAGGAGGSVFLVADEVSLATGAVTASGGFGQASYIRAGGDGGEGRVRVDCATCNGAAQGTAAASAALADACDPDPGASSTP